jgi:hypothetical protein
MKIIMAKMRIQQMCRRSRFDLSFVRSNTNMAPQVAYYNRIIGKSLGGTMY